MNDENPARYPFNADLEISVVEAAARMAGQEPHGRVEQVGAGRGIGQGGGEGFVLVDIREPEELALASVAGALHIPMGDLAARVHEIDIHEGGTIALICHTGRRSLHAAVALRRMGIEEARSVAGGIDWWSLRVDPTVPRY